MKAQVLTEVKAPLELQERPALKPGSDEAVVTLRAAALNRRDYWITQGMYPGIEPPVVLGSDGAGVVSAAAGDGESWLGRDVIINPGCDWGPVATAQSDEFTILGLPHDGTFATEVVVPASQLYARPGHLDWQQAAALPLAGVTAWRALFTQGHLKPGQSVLISGIGGGVATMALQFAVAAEARVWVTSSSDEKIAQAVALGAAGGSNYREDGWTKTVTDEFGPPELIIDSAGGAGYRNLINVAAPGGRIVNYGATTGPPEKLDLFKVFWKQLHLIGTTMGSPADFSAMVSFVEEVGFTPAVDEVFPLESANEALDRMASSPQFGKYVLAMPEQT